MKFQIKENKYYIIYIIILNHFLIEITFKDSRKKQPEGKFNIWTRIKTHLNL